MMLADSCWAATGAASHTKAVAASRRVAELDTRRGRRLVRVFLVMDLLLPDRDPSFDCPDLQGFSSRHTDESITECSYLALSVDKRTLRSQYVNWLFPSDRRVSPVSE